ncbi:SPK domain-containing protein [Caenorhabditis elegans]|nr:SPK domain-containing protein [Caenorhabditis elegans]CCD72191.1 SPK domain-containing protein [Caenorhabditis elegans]|eukprot:NP_871689.1 Uncharacterized protein CELE_H05C05.2 [Caenorhabditis elegans]
MQNNSTSQPMETSDISSPQYDSLYHFYRANSTQNDLLTAAAAEVLNPPSPKESKLGIVFSRPNYGDVTTSRHDVESPKNVVNNFVVTPIETPSTPVQYPPQAPFSDENYYAKFLKEMYCFLSDIDKNRFSKLKDLSRQAARLNKGMKLQPSTIKSYMEFCLDSLIVDKRVSHPTDKLLNSKKLLEELQETIEDMGPVMKYALHPILAEISPTIGNLDVVSKDSLEKSFENMIEQLQKRCDMNY